MKKILVMGSATIDLTTYSKADFKPGQTVNGESYETAVGGKGLNQAFAVKSLGGDVSFICAIGHDDNGSKVYKFLEENNLNNNCKISGKSTGFANILVNLNNAENQIIIIPGANDDITKDDIDLNIDLFKNCDIFLTQLENPVDTVCYAIKKAKEFGKFVILNSAPYKPLPKETFQYIDLFVPNEHELEGYVINHNASYKDKCKEILKLGAKSVLVTLGAEGSIYLDKEKYHSQDAFKVNAIDTVGAGDCFCGALAVALAEGENIENAMLFATKASSIAVTRKGATPSIPKRAEII